MANIVKDVTDKLFENADENLVEGNKVVRDLLMENADENLLQGNSAVQQFLKESIDELNQHKKQTTAAVAIAATLAAGGAGVADVDTTVPYTSMRAPAAVVLDISEPPTVDLDDDEDEDKSSISESGIKAEAEHHIGETIAKVIFAPIYVVGMGIFNIIQGVFSAIGAPVLIALLKWVITAAVILGALAIAFKTAFPDIPLKKLLNKKCVSFVFIAVAVVSAVCEIAAILWPTVGVWIEVARVVFGLVITILIFVAVMNAFSKKKVTE